MAKQVIIRKLEEIYEYKDRILSNANRSIEQLRKIVNLDSSLDVLYQLKFNKCVAEPLSGEPENFIEILNQIHTYLVSIKAIEELYKRHPEQTFIVNLGNVDGYDILSEDGSIIAECFAATSHRSNSKLSEDLKRLDKNKEAEFKYEFFYVLEFSEKSKKIYQDKYPNIKIVNFTEINRF